MSWKCDVILHREQRMLRNDIIGERVAQSAGANPFFRNRLEHMPESAVTEDGLSFEIDNGLCRAGQTQCRVDQPKL